LRVRRRLPFGAASLAATAATASAAGAAFARLLLAGGVQLLLLGGFVARTLLLLLLRAAAALALFAALTLLALSLRLLLAALALTAALTLRLLLALRFHARPLLELAELLLHVLPHLRLAAQLDLVVTAIGATLPAFWIRFLAGRAEYGLGKRHVETARIGHFPGGRQPPAHPVGTGRSGGGKQSQLLLGR
jgi:hypothetical protein